MADRAVALRNKVLDALLRYGSKDPIEQAKTITRYANEVQVTLGHRSVVIDGEVFDVILYALNAAYLLPECDPAEHEQDPTTT